MSEPEPKSPMRSEFILAMSIFVAMAVVGTAFALWFVAHYASTPTHPTPVASPR